MDQWSHEMKVHCCAVKRIGCELMNFDCKATCVVNLDLGCVQSENKSCCSVFAGHTYAGHVYIVICI